MGIVNVTPDSFSDGGLHASTPQALRHAEQLLNEGAAILDIGAESTRPGAEALPLAEELLRLEPLLREVVRWKVPISVDTYKPQVMQACLDWGVDIINDIWALRQPGAQQVVAAHPRCGVCLMHMHRDPQTMQIQPMTGHVVSEVNAFLRSRIDALLDSGVHASRLVVDPGIGFGKTVAQNFQLLARQADLLRSGVPVLAGWSRKSALGAALAQGDKVPEPSQRQVASVAAALLAVERGASVVRVHDVKATVDALKIWLAMQQQAASHEVSV
jgi:dihydropteroate synthase